MTPRPFQSLDADVRRIVREELALHPPKVPFDMLRLSHSRRELGISDTTLRKWNRIAEKQGKPFITRVGHSVWVSRSALRDYMKGAE